MTKAPDGQAFTLVEVPELLTNSGFRRAVTAQPGLSPQLHRFWRWFNSLSEPHQENMCAPLLNKLRTFTLSSSLRGLLGQSNGLRFGDVSAVVDEFQDVMKLPLDVADMLSQARGLGLGVTLAHQTEPLVSDSLQH